MTVDLILEHIADLDLDELREEERRLDRALAGVRGLIAGLDEHDAKPKAFEAGLRYLRERYAKTGFEVYYGKSHLPFGGDGQDTPEPLSEHGDESTPQPDDRADDGTPLEDVRNEREDPRSSAGPSEPPPADSGSEGPTKPAPEDVRPDADDTGAPAHSAQSADDQGPSARESHSSPQPPAGPPTTNLTDKRREVLAAFNRAGDWAALRDIADDLGIGVEVLRQRVRDLIAAGWLEHNGGLTNSSRYRVRPGLTAPVDEPPAPDPTPAPTGAEAVASEPARALVAKSGRLLRLERAEQRRAESRARIAGDVGNGSIDENSASKVPPKAGTLQGEVLQALAWKPGTLRELASRLRTPVDERPALAMAVAELYDEGTLELQRPADGGPSIYNVVADVGPAG